MSWATFIIASLAAFLGAPAHADDCFCLSHPTGAVVRGCESYKAPTDQFPTAVCTDPDTGKRSQQTLYPDSNWSRVEAGADGCTPCRPATRGTAKELPRGGGDDKTASPK